MKLYLFRVVVEVDDDWWAFVPELEAKGAATLGHMRDQALRNVQEVTKLVVEELIEDGQALPTGVTVSDGPVVAAHIG